MKSDKVELTAAQQNYYHLGGFLCTMTVYKAK